MNTLERLKWNISSKAKFGSEVLGRRNLIIADAKDIGILTSDEDSNAEGDAGRRGATSNGVVGFNCADSKCVSLPLDSPSFLFPVSSGTDIGFTFKFKCVFFV